MSFGNVLGTELTKLRRSKVTWISFAAYAFMVGIGGAFLWMMMHPAVAQSLGLIGQKAKLAFGGESLEWATFLKFITEMGGFGGLILCSVIVTYVFGREYSEGTAKNMLGLPTPRSHFVLAKILLSALWFTALTLWCIVETYLVGVALGLGAFTWEIFLTAAKKLLVLALMSMCCSLLAAWVAVRTRGYFAPLGYTIFTLLLTMIFSNTGWGPWIPWSVIGIYAGAGGAGIAVGWGSSIVMAATFLLGTALVIRHEVHADNAQ